MNSMIRFLMWSENVLEAKAMWSRHRYEVVFKVSPDQVTWRWLDGLYRRLSSYEVDEVGVLHQVGPIEFVLVGFGDPALLAQQLGGSSGIRRL